MRVLEPFSSLRMSEMESLWNLLQSSLGIDVTESGSHMILSNPKLHFVWSKNTIKINTCQDPALTMHSLSI